MAWNRNDPDPLEARRRQLEEREKNLAEQRRILIAQMQLSSPTEPGPSARAEPLVWRNEDDVPTPRIAEPATTRKRNLARQTRRDRIVAVGLIILLVVVIVIGFWIARAHAAEISAGA